jgi:beta-N-acetylhexosaminidase
LFEDSPAGGVLFFRINLEADNNVNRSFLGDISSLIKNVSGIAPFMAIDHEGGTVYRFSRGFAYLPNASDYWDISLRAGRQAALEKIEADCLKAGSEIKSLGFNLNFAPVAEYLNDDNRDFLRFRSYGPDPVFNALAASTFVRAMEQAGVLCVIKHFPGSAGIDPHYFESVLHWEKDSLSKHIAPFAALINYGKTRAIMIAHSSVLVLDNKIASLSEVIMENWLREELGFNGIIICDDFIMASAGDQKSEEKAVQSITAGADMIIVWPDHIRRVHGAFITALEDGTLSRERLQEAAARIVYEKLKMGIVE